MDKRMEIRVEMVMGMGMGMGDGYGDGDGDGDGIGEGGAYWSSQNYINIHIDFVSKRNGMNRLL